MSKYVIIFMTLLVSFFGVFSSQTDMQTAASIKNRQYTSYLASATTDAASEMASETKEANTLPYKSSREKVVNTFFSSLAINFGYDTKEDMTKLRMYVPVIAMIDTDGYYVAYNKDFMSADGVPSLESAITTINTWTAVKPHLTVRYYLGNKVDITTNNGKFISDTYANVYSEIKKLNKNGGYSLYQSELEALGFNDKDKFEHYRNETIIQDIQDKVEYYINNQNKVAAALQPEYIFEMPLTKTDDWVRVLENPTVIAFMQGVRISDSKRYLNIYSLGGGEVKRNKIIGFDSAKQYKYDSNGNLIAETNIEGYVNNQGDVSGSGNYINYDTYEKTIRSDGDEVYTGGGQKEALEKEAEERSAHVHHHTGSPISGGGCYVPVYHTEHNENCYETIKHVHTDACYGMVSHVHTDECYRTVYHHHSIPAGGSLTAQGNCTVKGGCFTRETTENSVTVYAPTCAKWAYDGNADTESARLAGLSAAQRKLVDESSIRASFDAAISAGMLHLTGDELEAYVKKTLKENYEALKNNSIESRDLICGHETGDRVKSTTPTCGKTEGQVTESRLRCTKGSGDIDHYEIGCGYEEGQIVK